MIKNGVQSFLNVCDFSIQRVATFGLFQGDTSFVDHMCYLCLVFLMLSRLFIAALWSPAGKSCPLGSCL